MSGIEPYRVYSKRGSNRWIRRFVEAVGDQAAPRHHPLHGRPAVRYRDVYKHGHVSLPKYCSVVGFRTWSRGADHDEEATSQVMAMLRQRVGAVL